MIQSSATIIQEQKIFEANLVVFCFHSKAKYITEALLPWNSHITYLAPINEVKLINPEKFMHEFWMSQNHKLQLLGKQAKEIAFLIIAAYTSPPTQVANM